MEESAEELLEKFNHLHGIHAQLCIVIAQFLLYLMLLISLCIRI